MFQWAEVPRRRGIAATLTVLAGVSLLTPLRPAASPETTVGLFLILGAVAEWLHGLRRSTVAERWAAWREGAVTLLMAVLLLAAPFLTGSGLVMLLGLSFAAEGMRHLVRAARRHRRSRPGRRQTRRVITGLVDTTAGAGLLLFMRDDATTVWVVAVAGAFRLFDTAGRIAQARVISAEQAGDWLIEKLHLIDLPELRRLGDALEVEATTRAPVDRGWVTAFLATLLAIHAGRMGGGLSPSTLLGPIAAVFGDIVLAVLFTMGVTLPLHMAVQRVSQPFERRAWRWLVGRPPRSRLARLTHGGLRAMLMSRLRSEMQWQMARLSLPAALGRGVRVGLPFAAIVAATAPMWGMSWYFDTENWAAGIYNSWAETRTDQWREAMVRAVVAEARQAGRPTPDFSVSPPGLGPSFSFVVIGDTGEGDASQHILRDRLLAASAAEDVRFVVVSSDVVYPTGAMRDYEAKFWLPFKGVTKPVYAIPGNHDWYDALEGFNATFLTAAAARTAIGARVGADLNISTTTASRIDDLVGGAARLRREYRVPTGFQQAPFFDIQTETFALLAIDTGVVKRVDDEQYRWLHAALARARGKMIVALLGHPFYASGMDLRPGHEDFQGLHQLLRAHGVAMVMAGDTHDLEHYIEPADTAGPAVHHVVNGGGGAYLSFGSALDWPAQPALGHWAFYPSSPAAIAKIDALTPWWKRPAWWWTRRFGAWPFSAEWLSAAFDYNTAPFFQSFVVVRVEPARIVVHPYGVHGPLRWSDFTTAPGVRPADAAVDAPVEWVVERQR